ncbi:hypothetical protein HPP92_005423 [Vanilla planifolia]|uniref:Aminotransferase class V domain-containing protein n=1 Tax=Vanilla planifolia TaxID=51239 RepID=A0A835RS51_VANPL|nr:hypothetical protein HPP92_005423 [Vanilla planifolia]
MERLLRNPCIQVLGNLKAKRLAILSFLVFSGDKPLHGRFVAKLLNDLFGIQARGGCACAGPYGHRLLGVEESLSLHIRSLIEKGYNGLKPGWTRVSFAYYLTKEEFAFILDAIEFIASYGHRFLSLYHLDWMTGDWTINRRALGHHLLRKESLVWLKDGHRKKKSHYWFGSYMKDAQRIARSLPEHPQPVCIPDGVDPNLVLFKI